MKHNLLLHAAILLTVCITFTQTARDGDDDEDKPYEFGFTIENYQHRHEKKDINGIIQGEFGFITADGIYHVTVYATDENGDFHILSMKNIRVSPPLDQVGPQQYKQNKQNNKQPVSQAQRKQQNGVTRAPLEFTTQSTIKPACAGCGYVEAPKKNEKFAFQTPAFQQKSGGFNENARSGNGGVAPQEQLKSYGKTPKYLSDRANDAPPGGNFYGSNNNDDQPQTNPRLAKVTDGSGIPVNGNAINGISANGKDGSTAVNRQPKTSSRVTVSNNVIRVSDKQSIPIVDRYPNMVDGLPPSIEEKDITDLLYKFNYTVGFHGHYERGYKSGAKVGGYFVNGRDGISRIVTYVADENGFRPKVKFVNLGLDSPLTPREDTEKTFGLKSFEFVWYPVD